MHLTEQGPLAGRPYFPLVLPGRSQDEKITAAAPFRGTTGGHAGRVRRGGAGRRDGWPGFGAGQESPGPRFSGKVPAGVSTSAEWRDR